MTRHGDIQTRSAARLLVVEDEHLVAMHLEARLQAMGYQVLGVAGSGEDAIRLAGEHKPNLVLMDIHLQGAMDGVAAAEVIRARHRIPVVYLTAYADQNLLHRAKSTEPYGYILKPFLDRELQVVIEMSLYRHQMEAKYHEAQKLETVGRLAGGIAHDFNNLLTVINGYTDLILARLPLKDPKREMLEQVARAGTRAAALTQQLLAYSRKQIMQWQEVDLNEVLLHTTTLLRTLLGDDIDLSILPGPALPHVKVDPTQFEQVLMTLAIQARNAMRSGGTLTIETRTAEITPSDSDEAGGLPRGLYVVLILCDTSGGLEPDVCANLFEPFFKARETDLPSGLEMAAASGTVKQLGGLIEVESELGVGTTFRIWLPALPRGPLNHGATPPVGWQRGTETILLVEDDEGVRRLTAHSLTLCGYTVLAAANGQEALAILARHQSPIQLMVTDVEMPGMSGPQLARTIQPTHPHLKVLYQSGYTEDALLREDVAHAQRHFLQKPFTIKELAAQVRLILDTP